VEEKTWVYKEQDIRSFVKITIPVSVGELIDKITILEIKSLFTDNEYVTKELEELNQIKSTFAQYTLDAIRLLEE